MLNKLAKAKPEHHSNTPESTFHPSLSDEIGMNVARLVSVGLIKQKGAKKHARISLLVSRQVILVAILNRLASKQI